MQQNCSFLCQRDRKTTGVFTRRIRQQIANSERATDFDVVGIVTTFVRKKALATGRYQRCPNPHSVDGQIHVV